MKTIEILVNYINIFILRVCQGLSNRYGYLYLSRDFVCRLLYSTDVRFFIGKSSQTFHYFISLIIAIFPLNKSMSYFHILLEKSLSSYLLSLYRKFIKSLSSLAYKTTIYTFSRKTMIVNFISSIYHFYIAYVYVLWAQNPLLLVSFLEKKVCALIKSLKLKINQVSKRVSGLLLAGNPFLITVQNMPAKDSSEYIELLEARNLVIHLLNEGNSFKEIAQKLLEHNESWIFPTFLYNSICKVENMIKEGLIQMTVEEMETAMNNIPNIFFEKAPMIGIDYSDTSSLSGSDVESPVPEVPVPEAAVPQAPVPEVPVSEVPVPEALVPEVSVPEALSETSSSDIATEVSDIQIPTDWQSIGIVVTCIVFIIACHVLQRYLNKEDAVVQETIAADHSFVNLESMPAVINDISQNEINTSVPRVESPILETDSNTYDIIMSSPFERITASINFLTDHSFLLAMLSIILFIFYFRYKTHSKALIPLLAGNPFLITINNFPPKESADYAELCEARNLAVSLIKQGYKFEEVAKKLYETNDEWLLPRHVFDAICKKENMVIDLAPQSALVQELQDLPGVIYACRQRIPPTLNSTTISDPASELDGIAFPTDWKFYAIVAGCIIFIYTCHKLQKYLNKEPLEPLTNVNSNLSSNVTEPMPLTQVIDTSTQTLEPIVSSEAIIDSATYDLILSSPLEDCTPIIITFQASYIFLVGLLFILYAKYKKHSVRLLPLLAVNPFLTIANEAPITDPAIINETEIAKACFYLGQLIAKRCTYNECYVALLNYNGEWVLNKTVYCWAYLQIFGRPTMEFWWQSLHFTLNVLAFSLITIMAGGAILGAYGIYSLVKKVRTYTAESNLPIPTESVSSTELLTTQDTFVCYGVPYEPIDQLDQYLIYLQQHVFTWYNILVVVIFLFTILIVPLSYLLCIISDIRLRKKYIRSMIKGMILYNKVKLDIYLDSLREDWEDLKNPMRFLYSIPYLRRTITLCRIIKIRIKYWYLYY